MPGPDLPDAPDGGVDAGDEPDLADARAVGGEEQRHQAPGERVVEVVDQSGLRARAQRRLAPARVGERLAERRRALVAAGVALLLERDVRGGVAHEGHGDHERDHGDARGRRDEHVARRELRRPASR